MNRKILALIIFWGCNSVLAGELSAVISDSEKKPVSDVVVVATPTFNIPAAKSAPKKFVIDQVDKEFINHVTALQVGTSVSFPNKDDIRHHVYSFSATKPFELPLYTGTPAKPVLFDKPGVVKLGCNIHDWMVAYVYIVDSPFFGTSDRDGKVQLHALPAGKYTVRAWHPRMALQEAATEQTVVVDKNGPMNVAWELALKPTLRPRRAPLPMQQGY